MNNKFLLNSAGVYKISMDRMYSLRRGYTDELANVRVSRIYNKMFAVEEK